MPTRKPHWVKSTKGEKLPSRFAIVDAELDAIPTADRQDALALSVSSVTFRRMRLVKGELCHATQNRYSSVEDFWSAFLASMCDGTHTVVITHKAQETWSALGLWEMVAKGELTVASSDHEKDKEKWQGNRKPWKGFLILEGDKTVIMLRNPHTRGTVRILDTSNFSLGDLPCPDLSSARVAELDDWLHDWICTIKRLKLGSFQNTLASQVWWGFRKSYYQAAVYAHDNVTALALERLAYVGGRCECRYIGTLTSGSLQLEGDSTINFPVPNRFVSGNIVRLDINSSYLASARDTQTPVQLLKLLPESEHANAINLCCTHSVIAAVTVRTNIPCVPWCQRRDALLAKLLDEPGADEYIASSDCEVYYPVGRFRTVLCGPELQLLAELGSIERVHMAAVYSADHCHTRIADALWNARQQARSTRKTLLARQLKLAPCLLVGKWGQSARHWQDRPNGKTADPYSQWYRLDPHTGRLCRWRAIGWRVQELVEGGETWDSCPAVAAYINSAARVRLWRLCEIAGWQNVYYYDTDSIWTNAGGLDALTAAGEVDHARLGKLKLEAEHSCVEFKGIKHYVADGKLTCASIPSGSQADLNGRYWFLSVDGMPYALPAKRPPIPVRVPVFRTEPHGYKHGKVSSDGSVFPLTVSLPDDTITGG